MAEDSKPVFRRDLRDLRRTSRCAVRPGAVQANPLLPLKWVGMLPTPRLRRLTVTCSASLKWVGARAADICVTDFSRLSDYTCTAQVF